MPIKKKFKIKVNSEAKLEELLQEAYDLACRQINETQIEMNKLSESTNLSNEPIEAKAKYSKAMNDFLATKDRAIGRKLEISKLLGEIIKHNGNVQEALESTAVVGNSSLNLDDLRRIANEAYGDDTPKNYEINKYDK
jgi:hypothetical protein